MWRAVLTRWRAESRLSGTIPKETFPRLLARVFSFLKSSNLLAGFKASGIVPFDSSEVLKLLPGGNSISTDISGEDIVNVVNVTAGKAGPTPR